MDVRDYDPHLSQFLTPDPLFFEDLDKCQSSPLQCSLYGYASGNPVNLVDPSGNDGVPAPVTQPVWTPPPPAPPAAPPPAPVGAPATEATAARAGFGVAIAATSAFA